MPTYRLPQDKLFALFLRYWERATIYYPILLEERPHLVRFHPDNPEPPAFEQIRATEPVKAFFNHFREPVASFSGILKKDLSDQILFGLKGCDLKALEVLDRVYLGGDLVDPFYEERRRRSLIIGTDCPQPEPSCFCNLVGGNPYLESGSDLNLFLLLESYGIEVVTDKGRKFVEENQDLFLPGRAEDIKARDGHRRWAQKFLRSQNPKPLPQDLAQRITARTDRRFWLEVGKRCVECYGCEQICPTCYCFLLYDEVQGTQEVRTRIWDHCYMEAYARVGGGLNPRSDFPQRFRNRFECKFSAFPINHGLYGCSGCGRCITACPARIDIREILSSI